MSSAKILVVAPTAFVLGGTQVWLHYLLPGLVKKGYRVIRGLVSGKFHDSKRFAEIYPFPENIHICSDTGSKEGRVAAIKRAIVATNPDLVVSINIVDVFSAMGRLKVSGKSNCKVIATLHGIQQNYLEDYTFFSETIDAVVCTNRLAQKLVNFYCPIDSRRIMYAPYGVLESKNSLVELEPAEKDNPIKLTVAFVSRFEETQKRVTDALNILGQFLQLDPGHRVVVAGNGPEINQVTKWCADEKHQRQVTFFGQLDAQKLYEKVYSRADILLLTSLWETGPIVAWEAMSMEVLLVTSRYIGCEEEASLLHMENCLMFETGDVSDAVTCLRKAMDSEVRRTLAINGRAMVESRYSQNISIDKWCGCFEKVLDFAKVQPSEIKNPVRDSGRLNKILGDGCAELVRKVMGYNFVHQDPGGEWPHSYGTNSRPIGDLIGELENNSDAR